MLTSEKCWLFEFILSAILFWIHMGQFSNRKKKKRKLKGNPPMSSYIFYVIIVSAVAVHEIKISQLTYECFNVSLTLHRYVKTHI